MLLTIIAAIVLDVIKTTVESAVESAVGGGRAAVLVHFSAILDVAVFELRATQEEMNDVEKKRKKKGNGLTFSSAPYSWVWWKILWWMLSPTVVWWLVWRWTTGTWCKWWWTVREPVCVTSSVILAASV